MGTGRSVLLSGATVTGAGASVQDADYLNRVYQATVSGTGTVSATILIQVSLDGTNWITLATITLSGTTTATDGAASDAPWLYTRANLTVISGTGATVNAFMGGK